MSMDRQEMYRELLRKQAIADRRAQQRPPSPRPARPPKRAAPRQPRFVSHPVALVTVEPDAVVGALLRAHTRPTMGYAFHEHVKRGCAGGIVQQAPLSVVDRQPHGPPRLCPPPVLQSHRLGAAT